MKVRLRERPDERANGHCAVSTGRKVERGQSKGQAQPAPRMMRFLAGAQFVGALAGATGWWLPWVLHPVGAAALVLLGLDLGEFLKFTSLWRQGQLAIERQLFFLPPVLGSLAISTIAVKQRVAVRLPLVLLAAGLAVVILPPYPYSRTILFSTEFRMQTTAALVGVVVALVAMVGFCRSPGCARMLLAIRVVLGSLGAALPLWAFWRIGLVLDGLYGGRVVVGPGLYLTTAGFAILSMGALVALVLPRARLQSR